MELTLANTLIGLASLIIIIFFLFILTHIDPLTEGEVVQLGTKRRNKQIHNYFSFQRREVSVNREFKKKMKPTGKFYQLKNNLYDFPAIAAALLKYKKHEWIMIAFERNKEISLIWLNKGPNRSSVTSYQSPENMAKLAYEKRATSILTFHNHPNPNPSQLNCTKPSDQDITSARIRSSILNKRGINLISFICERGTPYRYFLLPANSFLPLLEFLGVINEVNGQSRLTNLKLHIEKIF